MPKDYNELNALAIVDMQFTAVLVRMSNNFQKQIFKSYKKED